jgi:5-methylcytosine-specific restriction protein A
VTGFPRSVRDTVMGRSSGHCEICGIAAPEQIHHRRPRGSGGTRRPESNAPGNALAICRPCHEMVESKRELALEQGWLVRQSAAPDTVPVVYQGDWAVLTDDGAVFRPPRGSGRCERCGYHGPTQGHRPGCTFKDNKGGGINGLGSSVRRLL